MKILFYVEPLIELGRPYWKDGWANVFCKNIIDSLRRSGRNYYFTMIVNEGVYQRLQEIDVRTVCINQDELLAVFNDYLEASLAWYKESYTEDQMSSYCNLIKEKVGETKPDIIITFSPSPYLKKSFPESCVLHMEYSLFSRAPFPESFFLDDVGMNGGGVGGAFHLIAENNKIPKISLDSEEKIENFKKIIQKIILDNSPFRGTFKNWRKKFNKIVFVPLQFSEFYSFNGQVRYKNQFDFAFSVLKKISPDVGVVFCDHPQFPVFSEEIITFLSNTFSNFLFSKSFSKYDAAGQYIIGECDAVITVSSSLGVQAFLWDIPLISLGEKYLRSIANSNKIEDLNNLLFEKKKWNSELHWLITRYAIPDYLVKDAEWFSKYLAAKVEFSQNNFKIEDRFPKFFKNDDEIYNSLVSSFRKIPVYNSLTPEIVISDLRSQLKEKEFTLASLRNSRSWRYTSFIRKIFRSLRSDSSA